jgi:predicted amidohydrolase YtcJ
VGLVGPLPEGPSLKYRSRMGRSSDATRSERARRAGAGDSQPTRVWGSDQAVDRRTALRMVTLGAAFFIGEEKMLGSIEPGKYADLVVLNGDYLAVPDDRLDELEPTMTIVGGKIVFEAGSQQ